MASAATSHGGRLEVIIGCMFSGKTARLIALLAAAAADGRRVIAVKHSLDNRYDGSNLATHDRQQWPAVAIADVGALSRVVGAADVIGLDEAQFFGVGLLPVVVALRSGGRRIIVAGLRNDAWGQPFTPLPELSAAADETEHRFAPCTVCGAPAEFSQRMTPVSAGDMVGGWGDYAPRCRLHFTPLPGPAPVYA